MSSSLIQPRRSMRKSFVPKVSNSTDCSPIIKRKSLAPSMMSTPVSSKVITKPSTPMYTSQEPKTPQHAQKTTQPAPNTQYLDPIMTRLQRDFNSPSAAARIRANKALKSPGYRNQVYGSFDVPHERQDLITEEERQPLKPKTIAEIFAKCKIYVEVRTGDDNRSAGIKHRLLRDGITVNEKLYKGTTHVIFKDGLLSTYKNAVKLGIPVTTILWFDSCIAQKRLVDTDKFKISNLDRYERPELYKRLRRQKSMQPTYTPTLTMTPTERDRSMSQNDSRDDPKQYENATIAEEDVEPSSPEMEMTLKKQDASCFTPAPMEVATPKFEFGKVNQNRRITTFTPNAMEQTGIAAKFVFDRRQTMYTSQFSQKESDDKISTESSGNVFSHNSTNTIVFNSLNRIAKSSRRSVLDISMNLFDLNCKALSEKRVTKFTASEKIEEPQNITPTQVNKDQAVRKRRLFNNDNADETLIDKENLDKSIVKSPLKKKGKQEKLFTPNYKTPQQVKKADPKIDRRKTLSYFKTEKPKDISATKPKTPMKIAPAIKYIVCTNMDSADKQIITAAILKLGGKPENEVTARTTHIISPNEDRTMNILRGIIRACTIVNLDWVHDSIAAGKWLDTSIYHHSICDTNRVYERSVLGMKNYKNLTFANRGLFYLNKDSIEKSKKVIYSGEIIKLCGGSLTENKALAKFIVSDKKQPTVNAKQSVVVPGFVFDSAMQGTFLDATRYQPKA